MIFYRCHHRILLQITEDCFVVGKTRDSLIIASTTRPRQHAVIYIVIYIFFFTSLVYQCSQSFWSTAGAALFSSLLSSTHIPKLQWIFFSLFSTLYQIFASQHARPLVGWFNCIGEKRAVDRRTEREWISQEMKRHLMFLCRGIQECPSSLYNTRTHIYALRQLELKNTWEILH